MHDELYRLFLEYAQTHSMMRPMVSISPTLFTLILRSKLNGPKSEHKINLYTPGEGSFVSLVIPSINL